MGKCLAKCCCKEDEETNSEEANAKTLEEYKNPPIKEKELIIENLDKTNAQLMIPITEQTFKKNPVPRNTIQKEFQKEKIPLITNKSEEHNSNENKFFEEKSNNFQEIFQSPSKTSKTGNTESLIQELREIHKSQLALIRAKQHVLPNQIDERVENIDKNKKITDIFNVTTTRKENDEPERPPKIEEKDEEEDEQN